MLLVALWGEPEMQQLVQYMHRLYSNVHYIEFILYDKWLPCAAIPTENRQAITFTV